MTASRTALHLARALLWAAGVLGAGAITAKSPPTLELREGARIGLVTVLDAEVTHYHAAQQLQASFLKTQSLSWRVDSMLSEALQPQLAALHLVPVILAPGQALSGLREECFLEANLTKPLSKQCAAPYAQLAASEHLDALVVLGPGLNNALHAEGSRRKELPDYLRGWCVLTDAKLAGSTPTLLNLTEMLLIASTPQGPVLMQREWGGASSSGWTQFAGPPEVRQLSDGQLGQLQGLFTGMVRGQGQRLLAPVHVAR
jgi:hypothetical protein